MTRQVGDKVLLNSKEWYAENRNEDGVVHSEDSNLAWFCSEMDVYCGQVATITGFCTGGYELDIDEGKYAWEDWMFNDNQKLT